MAVLFLVFSNLSPDSKEPLGEPALLLKGVCLDSKLTIQQITAQIQQRERGICNQHRRSSSRLARATLVSFSSVFFEVPLA